MRALWSGLKPGWGAKSNASAVKSRSWKVSVRRFYVLGVSASPVTDEVAANDVLMREIEPFRNEKRSIPMGLRTQAGLASIYPVLAKAISRTAGKGDPYWYEWTVGLLKVVEMLHPESGINSVSFQVAGAKGWDDVVVRHVDGSAEYLQVKHSRVGRHITFGDLVAIDDNGDSLLSSLFAAWKEMKLRSDTDKCVLFTNRGAGNSTGTSELGVRRPPLLSFVAWLEGEVRRVKSLPEIESPLEWRDAWTEWKKQLAAGTDVEILEFLKSFRVQTNQEDLKELEVSVLYRLTELFQISRARALPFLHALDHALRRWTTVKEEVNAEDAYSALALDEAEETEHRAPPPPAPFFSSRHAVVERVQRTLTSGEGPAVVFLAAEPGAGKTSIVSQLANRRVDNPFEGAICLRYFAFRPITPEFPLIPADADYFVRADTLWFNLLSQLRQGLRGRLRAYRVPLRNSLLTWPEARTHVLRIAKRLGEENRRPFTIVIDGIDHAARAAQYSAPQAKEFFDSIPSPDEIAGSPLRLMLVGQPAESYIEYPIWLRMPDARVQKLAIGKLEFEDIRTLIRARCSPVPGFLEAALLEIAEITQGNTLAVVFAVEELRSCSTLEGFRGRLEGRKLGDGLQKYYSNIWDHAIASVEKIPIGTNVALATALCMTPERLTGKILASAFGKLGIVKEQWQILLAQMGPLVVPDPDGYRVLHNDVRVFLQGLLAAQSLTARQQAAGFLADYYLTPESNRWFAHKSILRLLRDAGREIEWAKIFTVDWVLEAAALDIPYLEVSEQCVEALNQGITSRDWDVMGELACATETVRRWEDTCESRQAARGFEHPHIDSKPLETELFVRPLAEWSVADMGDLVRDAEILIGANEIPRARALLERWLSGLSVVELSHRVNGPSFNMPENQLSPRLNRKDNRFVENLGALCRATNFQLKSGTCRKDSEKIADAEFELGWVKRSCTIGPYDSVSRFFLKRIPKYVESYKAALEGLATRQQWHLVALILKGTKEIYHYLGPELKLEAIWWVLKSNTSVELPEYLHVLNTPRFGLPEKGDINMYTLFALCRSLGWTNPGGDPHAIARKVVDSLPTTPYASNRQHHFLLFRAAVVLGQTAYCVEKRSIAVAADIFPPREMTQLAGALLEYNFHDFEARQHQHHVGELLSGLVSLGFQLGANHQRALFEAAKPYQDRLPLDSRLAPLWDLYKRSGDIPRLKAWLRRWLAEGAWLWSVESSERDSIAETLFPLARELGEIQLITPAQDMLRWSQIAYSGHKEYGFDPPITWFKELASSEPSSWRDLGLRLWILSEACSAQGGDNRCAWALGEALGSAAWVCGPQDVWKLFTAEYGDCGTQSWYLRTANRIVGGFKDRLALNPRMPLRDKLAGWCLAVGFSRWFSAESVKELAEIRHALIETCSNEAERIRITKELQRLTPAEARRSPKPPKTETVRSLPSASEEKTLVEWLRAIESGTAELDPLTAVQLLKELLALGSGDDGKTAFKILESVGVGGPYSWSSSSYGNYEALLEIARIATPEQLWSLVKAGTKYAGRGSAWGQGVSETLHHILLARAKVEGVPALRKGLQRMLDMHEKWSRGGRHHLELPALTLGPEKAFNSTGEFVAHALNFLLGSQSAEVIESALLGIHALVAHEPSLVDVLLESAGEDTWRQHWILNSAEVWAMLYPSEVAIARPHLETRMKAGPLHLRLQAWIVLRYLTEIRGEPPPEFPSPANQRTRERSILEPARQIFASPVNKRGSFNFVDRFRSAEGTIDRVEEVTGADLQILRSEVAAGLMQSRTEEDRVCGWIRKTCCSGDTRLLETQSETVIDRAFDDALRDSSLPESLEVQFSQAFLTSEDPWVARSSPLPDDDLTAWPSEEELGERGQIPLTVGKIRQKLHLLAAEHSVSKEEVVIAARVQVFSRKEDFILHLWWAEDGSNSENINPCYCPTTLNGRTFVFNLGDWWEPNYKRGRRPLAFGVGAQHKLSFCRVELFPPRLWITDFKWKPSETNPLLWVENDQPVARYERLHGDLRWTRSGHPRQPIMARWLLKKSSWEKLITKHGPFRMFDDLERFSSDVDH